jgi:CRISPR-associated protein Cmr3
MKHSHIYHIRLTPLAKYFFGGERFYDSEDGVFYFERSREYPQQTSVLGMLRYQLLVEAGLMVSKIKGASIDSTKTAEAEALIGEHSFRMNAPATFGQIRYLSPVTIIDANGKHWVDYPKARQVDDQLEDLKLEVYPGGRLSFGTEHVQAGIPFMANFDHKKGLEKGMKRWDDPSQYHNRKAIFNQKVQEEEQIGIYKPYRKGKVVEEQNDRGFYKYQYCHLERGFSFSCFVGADTSLPLQNQVVRLGKERVPFQMTVEEVAQTPFQNSPILPNCKLLLLSDTYLPGEWNQHCKMAVGDLLPFKNLQYSLATDDNYDGNPTKSAHRLNLLQRGTLLWVGDSQADADALQALFDAPAALSFWGIGYNHYEVI